MRTIDLKTVKGRDFAIDNLKAFAIILVVFGHSLQYLYYPPFAGKELYDNLIFRLIYMFHMPLFIFISGIFHSNKSSTSKFLSRQCQRLIVPMIFWAVLNNIFQIIFIDNFKITINSLLHSFLYDYWFIWCLFECKVILYIFNLIWNRFSWKGFLLICFLGFLIHPIIPRSNFLISLFPFYLLGFLLKKYRELINQAIKKNLRLIILLTLLIFIGSFIVWKSDYSIYASSYRLNDMLQLVTYQYYIVRILGGTAGIVLSLLIFYRWIKNQNILGKNLGRMTLGIYLLQYAYTKLLRIYPIEFSSEKKYFLAALSFSLACLIISSCIIYILQKNKLSNRYILGNI